MNYVFAGLISRLGYSDESGNCCLETETDKGTYIKFREFYQ